MASVRKKLKDGLANVKENCAVIGDLIDITMSSAFLNENEQLREFYIFTAESEKSM